MVISAIWSTLSGQNRGPYIRNPVYFNKSPNKESTRLRESRNLSYAFLGTSVQIIQVAEKKVSQPASAAINQFKLVFALSLFRLICASDAEIGFLGGHADYPKVSHYYAQSAFHGTSASSGHEQVSNCALEEFNLWGITLRCRNKL